MDYKCKNSLSLYRVVEIEPSREGSQRARVAPLSLLPLTSPLGFTSSCISYHAKKRNSSSQQSADSLNVDWLEAFD